MVPDFDFTAMAESAMGKYWPRADEQQRSEVVAEFQELLIRTYGSALLKYSGKPIEYGALKWSNDGKRALVPTKVEPVSGAGGAHRLQAPPGGRRLDGIRRGHRQHQPGHQLPFQLRQRDPHQGSTA